MNQSPAKETTDEENSKSIEIHPKHIDLDIDNVDRIQVNEDHFEIDHSGLQLHKLQSQMAIPRKTLIFSTFLLVAGISFIIAGLASLVGNDDYSQIISFLVFGLILTIPGIYYTTQFFKAYIADSPEERQEILDDIPM